MLLVPVKRRTSQETGYRSDDPTKLLFSSDDQHSDSARTRTSFLQPFSDMESQGSPKPRRSSPAGPPSPPDPGERKIKLIRTARYGVFTAPSEIPTVPSREELAKSPPVPRRRIKDHVTASLGSRKVNGSTEPPKRLSVPGVEKKSWPIKRFSEGRDPSTLNNALKSVLTVVSKSGRYLVICRLEKRLFGMG